MRRLQHLVSLFGFLLGSAVVVGCVTAPAAPMNSVDEMIDGQVSQLPNEWLDLSAQVERVVVPDSLGRAADSCDDPTLFEDSDGNALDIINMIASGQSVMNEFPSLTSSDDDPDLCYDGEIPLTNSGDPALDLAGYRTGWYQLRAPADGILHIEAASNFSYADNFDTIIAVHEGRDCDNFTRNSCSDDDNGLLSNVAMKVEEGEFYTIEIADRNLAVNGRAILNLQVYLEPTGDAVKRDNDWSDDLSNRSRHAAAAVGENIYIIGGQTVVDDNTPVRTGSVAQFNTDTRTWTEMSPMPAECASDGNGYSNNDVAVFNDFILFPSGYVGDSALNAGVHCIYDTLSDDWIVGDNPLGWVADPVSYAAVIPAHIPEVTTTIVTTSTVIETTTTGITSTVLQTTTNITTLTPERNGYYLVGGLNGAFRQSVLNSDARREVYFYTTTGAFWVKESYDLPEGRYAHTGALLDGRYVCVAGGLQPTTDDNPTQLSDILCLDQLDTAAQKQWHPIGTMNAPRHLAGSAINDEGVWHIYGGYSTSGDYDDNTAPVAIVETIRVDSGESEIYPSVDLDAWKAQFSIEQLDRQYNIDEPVRGWVRGDFVGDTLYLIGGETRTGGDIRVVNIVEAVRFNEEQLFLPLLSTGDLQRDANGEPNDNPTVAQPFKAGQTLTGNFDELDDLVDVYTFNPFANTIQFTLSGIPIGENYDLYIYDTQKRLVASSTTGGSLNEELTVPLEGGDHYVMVVLEGSNRIDVLGTYILNVEEID